MSGFICKLLIPVLMLPCCGREKSLPSTDRPEEKVTGIISSARTTAPSDPVLEENLRNSAMTGNTVSVEYLLSRNVNINATDRDGRTPMMLAAFNGHTGIVKAFLERGAPVNAIDSAGRTALIYASTGPYPETVKLLLSHQADPDISDNKDKFTALMFAASEGQLEVVRILLANNANPFLKDKDNDNAEIFARRNGHNEISDFIKVAAGKPNASTK